MDRFVVVDYWGDCVADIGVCRGDVVGADRGVFVGYIERMFERYGRGIHRVLVEEK